MKDIPFHLLKALLVVSKSQNLSEAASILKITQPGLSKQLMLLESLLPHKLFIVEGRKKRLTNFGIELVNQLNLKMDGIDSVIQQACERFSNTEQSTVRIVGRTGVLDRISSKLKYPGRLIFIDIPSKDTIDTITNQQAEIGITYLQKESFGLISKPLFVEKFKLVVPKSYIKNSSENIKQVFQNLKTFPCLTFKDPDELFIEILENCNLKISDYIIKRTAANFESILSMTNSEIGWSLVPRHFSIDPIKNWSLDIPTNLYSKRQFYLYYRKEMTTAPWLKQLRTEIQECLKSIDS